MCVCGWEVCVCGRRGGGVCEGGRQLSVRVGGVCEGEERRWWCV